MVAIQAGSMRLKVALSELVSVKGKKEITSKCVLRESKTRNAGIGSAWQASG